MGHPSSSTNLTHPHQQRRQLWKNAFKEEFLSPPMDHNLCIQIANQDGAAKRQVLGSVAAPKTAGDANPRVLESASATMVMAHCSKTRSGCQISSAATLLLVS